MLGEAWERTEHADDATLTLVIHHHSGRVGRLSHRRASAVIHALDINLIHRVWLDAVKAVGPHVHHHDVVRAALTQMERTTHRTATRRGAGARSAPRRGPPTSSRRVHRTRDFSAAARHGAQPPRRATSRALLTELSLEDQVVVFRVLPRKDAAAVFEYLSHDAQEALLKAMAPGGRRGAAQQHGAGRPHDVPRGAAGGGHAPAADAAHARRSARSRVTLLGYPEGSIGRLMTPHYVAVREHWTVREVLDYIRAHGQDSETLNVIYVVDEQGVLIDDIRIREFLLAPLDTRVSRPDGSALRRAEGDRRSGRRPSPCSASTIARALPVTDTAGVLIGIVTDRRRARRGGSDGDARRSSASADRRRSTSRTCRSRSARMIQKRAGWLTALFLGEMLTATAMGVFETEISKAVVLALFVPLIISSGGNSGSQASTLVIRALALGEVRLRDWWRVMRREIVAGLALGAHPRQHRLPAHHASGRRSRPSTARTGCSSPSPWRSRSSASCCGAR